MASITTATATCPSCQTASRRIHSRYTRTLHDLPWASFTMTLLLHVRRFRCLVSTCAQQIFTERLPSVVAPFARRTQRLYTLQQQCGLALGGIPGALVSQQCLSPISRTTILRFIQRSPDPLHPAPDVVGVDDWAFRKGQTYGTIIVDLERGTVLDLLPDRTSATLAAWLARHPTVRIVSRDRAQAYGEGIRLGAPDAVQVADRWHLMKTVVTALNEVLVQQAAAWEPALQAVLVAEQPVPAPTAVVPDTDPLPDELPLPSPGCPHRRARREARYLAVHSLAATGLSIRAITAATGISRNTVRRYLRVAVLPDAARRPRRMSVLDAYKPFIQERWAAGSVTAEQLFTEVCERGYAGKRSTVKAFVTHLRQPTTPHSALPTLPRPRAISGWICQRAAERTGPATDWLARLHRVHAGVSCALRLTERFLDMVRERQRPLLEDWLADAAASDLKPFHAVARGMGQD
ncbi:MAG: ISL3 family transposase, partial [Herpetosiphonaceae bacterium]|nr:ISL3 family transposase [Herpetosiphonaceae bacterium]